MNRVLLFIIITCIYFIVDGYLYFGVKTLFQGELPKYTKMFTIFYWTFTLLLFSCLFILPRISPKNFNELRIVLLSVFFIVTLGKLVTVIFFLIDDFRRLVLSVMNFSSSIETKYSTSRSEFLTKSALIAGTAPIVLMTIGLTKVYDYRIRKRTLYFENLPNSFDGIRIGQISDIHTGSLGDKIAVQGGVDMLNAEKPDIVFFTGDFVNDQSSEAIDFLNIFNKINASFGVYSIMGNHDYGDYHQWNNPQEQLNDIKKLHDMHKYMGWRLLLNENERLRIDQEEIAILGCENWGAGRFSKYGDMKKTYEGSDEVSFKLLLSHDPSHWDAEIRPNYPDVDLMLSGHTHGMQFGIEIGDFRWSPAKFNYKQWADLYKEGKQYLYVNRGFGFIGYPGRVGILPEITILELKKA